MDVSFRASIFMLFSMLCATSGCATAYVGALRREYAESGNAVGIYGEGDVYPSVYHATWVSTLVGVPRWVSPSRLDKAYVDSLRWIGLPLALCDVPISLVTDTFMLPYDAYKVMTEKDKEK